MKLTVFPLTNEELGIRPAPAERAWMDMSDQRFAYRCLPLAIANAHGWEILNPKPFRAYWKGGNAVNAVRIEPTEGDAPPGYVRPLAHFGTGVLTFELPMLFRTEPGWNLMVTGPLNRPKDGVAGLSGVIETDWSPYAFTMNWIFTRAKNWCFFKAGEPIAHIFPVKRGALDAVEPQIRSLHEEPELREEYETFNQSRRSFIGELQQGSGPAVEQKWQKGYFRGKRPSGAQGPDDHQTKIRVKPFKSE